MQGGSLLRGQLRINPKKRTEAYVVVEGLCEVDVFVDGEQNRNRCVTVFACAKCDPRCALALFFSQGFEW